MVKGQAYGKYRSATDGIYRSFQRSCAAGLADGINVGPTVSQFLGALLAVKDLKEDNLPQCWKDFAAAYPEYATILRRSALEFRTTEEQNFTVNLSEKTTNMRLFLLVSNPAYPTSNQGETNDDVTGPNTTRKKRKPTIKRQRKPQSKAMNDDEANLDDEADDNEPKPKKRLSMADKEKRQREMDAAELVKDKEVLQNLEALKQGDLPRRSGFDGWLNETSATPSYVDPTLFLGETGSAQHLQIANPIHFEGEQDINQVVAGAEGAPQVGDVSSQIPEQDEMSNDDEKVYPSPPR